MEGIRNKENLKSYLLNATTYRELRITESIRTMGDKTEDNNKTVALSRRLLEDRANSYQSLEGLTMEGIRIVESRKGFLRCHFIVSNRIADGDGNWEVGAMATLVEAVGMVSVFSLVGHRRATVDFSVSFFSTAKAEEEVEIEAKVVAEKGRLASVVIELRRRSNGELIALGKQWMASHKIASKPSKL